MNEYENHHNLLVNFDTYASLNLVKITFLYIFHSIGSIVLHQEVIQKNLWGLWVQPELLDLTPPPLYHRYTITLKQLYVIYNNIYLWRVCPTSDTCRSCCLTSWPAAQSTTCCLRWRSPAPPTIRVQLTASPVWREEARDQLCSAVTAVTSRPVGLKRSLH